jgi:hypothetical protein
VSDPVAEVMKVMAAKAAGHHAYLGWALALYQRAERATDADLASLLGADEVTLRRLSICLRPREDAFAADVRTVAEDLGLNPGPLAMLIRHADAVAAMQAPTGSAEGPGQLLAARFKTGTRSRIPEPDPPVTPMDGGVVKPGGVPPAQESADDDGVDKEGA